MNDIGIKIGIQGLTAYLSGLRNAERQTQAWSKRVNSSIRNVAKEIPIVGSSLSQLLTPAGAVAGAFGLIAQQAVSATRTAAAFQQQITQVGALAGLDKTTEQFKALEAEARRLGSTTEFSANEAAKAMEFLTRAGFTAQQTLEGTAGTLALATVGNLDLGKAADIATDTLSQFGLAASDLGGVVDVIAKTTVTANTNVTQFADAMNYLGATANALGISLPESSAVIGVLSSAGLKGSLATRAFGTALVRLTKPSREARDAIKELNLNAFDSQGNFVGIANLIAQLETGFKGYTQEQRQSALATIFGAEAIQEFNILLEKGSGELRSYTKQLEGAQAQNGKFSEGIRTQFLDTFNGAVKNLSSAFEGLQIALASGGLDPLAGFVNTLADGLRAVTGFVEGTKSLTEVLYENAEIVGVVAVGLGALVVAVGSVVSPIALVVAGITTAITVFVSFYKSNERLRASVAGIVSVFSNFGDVIKSTVIRNLENFQNILKSIINGDFTGAISAIKAAVKTLFLGVGESAAEEYQRGFNQKVRAESFIKTIENATKEALQGLSTASANAFSQGLITESSFKDIAKAISDRLKELSSSSSEVVTTATKTGDSVGKSFGKSFAKQAIETIVTDIPTFLSSNAGKILSAFDNLSSDPTQVRSTSLATPDNAAQTSAVIQQLGLDLQFVNSVFASTNDLLDAISSTGFRVADSLGASTQNSLAFAASLENFKQNAFENTINIVGSAVEGLGRQLGEAVKAGKSTAEAFAAFAKTIVAQGLKYLGLFLLNSAATLGFPAGIPFAVAGALLLGASGFVSGLGGARSQQQSAVPTVGTGNATGNLSQNSVNQAQGANLGLSNQFQQRTPQTVVYIQMDGEEISQRVVSNIETNNILQGSGFN